MFSAVFSVKIRRHFRILFLLKRDYCGNFALFRVAFYHAFPANTHIIERFILFSNTYPAIIFVSNETLRY